MPLTRQPTAILLTILLAFAACPGAAAGTVIDEGIVGDFSNDALTPTPLGIFGVGEHVVSGTLGASDNNDYFTFTVDGLLGAITLASRSGTGNTFIGLFAEAVAPLGTQIGEGFFAAAEIGGSPFNTLDPFASGPLPGGDFTIGLTNLQGIGYALVFSVVPVPLPAAWLALLPAAGVLLRRRRNP